MLSPTAVLTDAPVLAHVTRGDLVESVHRVAVAVTGPDGTVELALGGVENPIYPRSALKPLQALAGVRAGLDLPPTLLALACSSHSGEQLHLDGVRRILAGVGLGLDALQTTPALPLGEAAQRAWLAAGRVEEAIAQDCSGKHAGFLATCVARGWDTTAYRELDHPLQRAVWSTVEELTDARVSAVAPDGCGAPVLAIPLTGLARAFGRLAAAEEGSDERRVADAMRAHPEMVGGTGRDVTALMAATPGLVAKDGAEAVYAVGLPDGRGVALKVVDGATRARPVVMAAVLRYLGVETTAYAALEDAPVLGHGRPVGAVEGVPLASVLEVGS